MALIFSDGFEDEQFTKTSWETPFPGTWDLIRFDTGNPYEGSQSLYFESGPAIFKNFTPTGNVYVRYAFCDLGSTSSFPCHIQCRINDRQYGNELSVGVEMEFSNNYVYRIKGERVVTGVPRAPGWHVFEVWINDVGSSIAIDGTFVVRDDPRITVFESLAFMSSPGPSEAYWDAVGVHSDAQPPPDGNGTVPPMPEEMVKPLVIGGVLALLMAVSL